MAGRKGMRGVEDSANAAYVAAALDPLRPVHPGEILQEDFLAPLGLNAPRAARRMGVPRTRIERLVRQETPVTPDTALRLERLFGASALFWMNLQTRFDLLTTRPRMENDLARIEPLTVESAAQ